MFQCRTKCNALCMIYNHMLGNVYREILVKINSNRIEYFYKKML